MVIWLDNCSCLSALSGMFWMTFLIISPRFCMECIFRHFCQEREVRLISCRHAAQTTKNVIGWRRTAAAADCCPVSPLLFWQSGCWSCCLRPVVTGCCHPSLHVSVRQALPDLSSAWGLPAPRRGPSLHHIPSNYWHPAAFEHTGIIVKNSRGQTADGEGWKQQSLK